MDGVDRRGSVPPLELEEILLFDHPSGYTRISTAMRWKAEQRR